MEQDQELPELSGLLQAVVDAGVPVQKDMITAVAECALRHVNKYKKVRWGDQGRGWIIMACVCGVPFPVAPPCSHSQHPYTRTHTCPHCRPCT